MDLSLVDKEKEILKHLSTYPALVKTAGEQYSPALVANYLYELVKIFNSFYQNVSVFGSRDQKLKSFVCCSVEQLQTISNLPVVYWGLIYPIVCKKKSLLRAIFLK